MLGDRRRRQQGSILSGLLIIVAFLAILIGALLTELTDSFIASRELADRYRTEATGMSAVELAINQAQNDVRVGGVPAVCVRDPRGPWFLTLNGRPAAVTQTCSGIVPELPTSLAAGSFRVDGIHDTTGGRDRYLVSNNSGQLYSYPFGQTTPTVGWPIALGGSPTGPPLTASDPNGSVNILVPIATGGTCGGGGHCVAVFNDVGGQASFHCNLPANATVGAVAAGGAINFSGYAFFGDSGRLYVYDARVTKPCPQLSSAVVGGAVVGAPLVVRGRVTNNPESVSDEVFIVVTSSTGTSLQHWQYSETIDEAGGHGPGNRVVSSLNPVGNPQPLNGNNATGYAISSTAPPLSLVVATASGSVDMAGISGGPSYTMSGGVSVVLPNGSFAPRAPYWCHCPGGQDLIGIGGNNGVLYLLNTGLAIQWSYDARPDGVSDIDSTPVADINGEWYFGANDGSVYDVEIPVTGPMFKAAKFGPGGEIDSSPIVGSCPNGMCLYFGSATAGSYFARIGVTRVTDLRACVSSSPGSATCVSNPRLWARVKVGPSAVWGGSGVFVQGWSFYSP